MEYFVTCTLALLEMTFVLVALLLLHGLRKLIGSAGFYISLGLLLVFTQLVNATELKVVLGYPGFDFYIAPTVLFLPYLTALMIVYITEGTLTTQRLIIGAMATLGFYLYLSHITSVQCNWAGYTISQGPTADSMEYLMRQSQRTMAGSILAQTLDLFLIPIFFQRLRNMGCRIFFSVLGALVLTVLIDTMVYTTACYYGPQWWLFFSTSYMAKVIAIIWLSLLTTIYLTRIENEIPGESRSALDIVFAFFGGYGKAQALEQNLREWEGRYRMVVENASDMILLLNQQGVILDANFAAVRIFELRSRDNLRGKIFPDMIFHIDGSPVKWGEYSRSFRIEDTTDGPHIQRLLCHAKTKDSQVDLDIAISSIEVDEVAMMIVLGRDVTEQNRLAREKEELSAQLAHAQRLESVGKLAGGVAHDFNNYIHAILGHLDVITYIHKVDDKKVMRHLDKIIEISEQASKLTRELLGFARKGKYIRKTIRVNELMEHSIDLFMPNTQEGLDFSQEFSDREMYIKGDPVQLQQVLLNLLLNARDAMEESGEKNLMLAVKTDSATNIRTIKLTPPKELKAKAEDFVCIKVSDNGCGMDQDTINRIFEPFFTTKPYGKGTGMGLAMVYGTISNHNGWIQVESEAGKGTTFYIFLPIALPSAGETGQIPRMA